ncbi:esterase-like activity of phytase family protein [Sphingobium boeckii]|uniref:Phytase-like domain-containing protein n=1 Tax=Sphingobium boeckii TaxID=1082345 RepID=A0A7W9AF49_9SPHN|nr:esterase-like activity of phytase family protein [Sphingobium boeckii]MBB5684494.1 hypothetical protein [Sphingobium boeckii]
MRLLIPILLPFILVLGGDAGGGSRRVLIGNDTRIVATPVPLDPDHPKRGRAGGLIYLGGWVLQGKAPGFGGISGMAMDRDALMLISDAGGFMRLTVDSQGAIRGARFGDFRGGPGTGARRRDRDSESIAIDSASGRIWVGFERFNAIARYAPGFAAMEALAFPAAMKAWPGNGGPEAMVRLSDGRFLVFSEAAGQRGQNDALLFDRDPTDPAAKSVVFRYRPPAGYRITEAKSLPDGRLILLHRRLSFPEYFSAKVAILDPAEIKEGAIAQGKEIASLVRPMAVDNMEAMAVTQENRRTIIWIGSDDNFGGTFQRTLLMKFALSPGF